MKVFSIKPYSVRVGQASDTKVVFVHNTDLSGYFTKEQATTLAIAFVCFMAFGIIFGKRVPSKPLPRNEVRIEI
jgi:hypothetical protein